jgi:hypothetical protein
MKTMLLFNFPLNWFIPVVMDEIMTVRHRTIPPVRKYISEKPDEYQERCKTSGMSSFLDKTRILFRTSLA